MDIAVFNSPTNYTDPMGLFVYNGMAPAWWWEFQQER